VREPSRKPFEAGIPQEMVKTVHDNRVNTRVAGQYFPGISCCWITLEYAIDIFTNADFSFL